MIPPDRPSPRPRTTIRQHFCQADSLGRFATCQNYRTEGHTRRVPGGLPCLEPRRTSRYARTSPKRGRSDTTAERRLRARLHHARQSHEVIALAAAGQLGMAAAGPIRLAVLTPWELPHTFVSVMFESGVAVEDRPTGRALQLEDDRGHLPSRAAPGHHHRRRRHGPDPRLDHAAPRGPGFPYRHCLSWNFRHGLEDRACG